MGAAMNDQPLVVAVPILEWLQVTDAEVVDLGSLLNAESRLPLFREGELMQFSGRVNGLMVRVAHYTEFDEFRVAFGDEPVPLVACDCLNRERARALIIMEVCDVR